MCIIISKPEKRKLDTKYYVNAFKHNKDGAGVAYVENKELKIKKGIFNSDDFVKFVEEREDQELLIHCRVATHGLINTDNCHPFIVPPTEMFPHISFAIAHNGQLPWRSTATKSDTACFIEDLLGPWLQQNPWFFDQPHAEEVMGKFITDKNKLVVMRYDSKADETATYIVNDKEGIKAFGCWFSNDTYVFSRIKYVRAEDEYGGYGLIGRGIQGHLPGYANAVKGLPPAKTDKVGSVLDDFGDWVKFENKWLNFNPNYIGAGKMTDEQRVRWKKSIQDRTDALKLEAEAKEAAEKAKANAATNPPPPAVPKDGKDASITVPRDPEVVDSSCDDMHWLNAEDKHTLKVYAITWLRKYKDYHAKTKTLKELLGDFRQDIKALLPSFKGLSDANTDMQFLLDPEVYLADMETKDTELAMAEEADKYVK